MIGVVLLAVTWAAINYVRGRGYLPAEHILAPLAWAATGSLFIGLHGASMDEWGLSYVAIFFGTLLWLVPPWGLFFSAYHGRWERWNPNATNWMIKWIVDLGYWLVPFVGTTDLPSNRERGTLCMALRGLYILPLFIMLGVLLDPRIAVCGFIGLLQGPAYGVMRYLPNIEQGTQYAEPLTMFIYGLTFGAVVHYGVMT